VIEKIALFGEAKNLVGVVTQPSGGAASGLAFVLLNAGVIHRIGPNRLNVKLARRLAVAGFTAVRFDLSGIGDSRVSQSTLSFEAQAVADIRAAMDYMQNTRAMRRFVLVGLCSGADNAYATAQADERVLGLVMLDPYVYPTRKTRLRFLLMRLGSPLWLARYLRRRGRRILGGLRGPGERNHARPLAVAEPNPERYVRQEPPLAAFAAGLRRVLDRGGAVITMYTGSFLQLYNYPRQLDDALQPFGLAGRIDCRLWPEANHTYSELPAQAQLLDTILEWATGLSARHSAAESPAEDRATASDSAT
jgi:pimeloyl-ACP methyl ester carboxylesterase